MASYLGGELYKAARVQPDPVRPCFKPRLGRHLASSPSRPTGQPATLSLALMCQQHLDELFLSPPCPVALPRAYWLDPVDRVMSSQLMLIQPSEFEFNRVMNATSHAKSDDYDMEIVNYLYRDSALILPHRPYDILTGEFRSNDHADYLGNAIERWDPDAVLKEAKYLHFSDWPVPKVCLLPSRPVWC